VIEGQYPTEHQLHETLEITHGFTDYFECGSISSPARRALAHIRPRFSVPEKWWRGRGPDARDGSSNCEDDPRISFRLLILRATEQLERLPGRFHAAVLRFFKD
jgi:hypothetical protein